MTKKQFFDTYGESEAEEMLEEDLVVTRPSKANPKRLEYLVTQESASKTFEKRKQAKAGGKQDVKGDEFQQLFEGMDDMQLVDKMLEDGNFQMLALDFDGAKPVKAHSAQSSKGKDKDKGKDKGKDKDKSKDKDDKGAKEDDKDGDGQASARGKGQGKGKLTNLGEDDVATEDLAKSKVKGMLSLVQSSEV